MITGNSLQVMCCYYWMLLAFREIKQSVGNVAVLTSKEELVVAAMALLIGAIPLHHWTYVNRAAPVNENWAVFLSPVFQPSSWTLILELWLWLLLSSSSSSGGCRTQWQRLLLALAKLMGYFSCCSGTCLSFWSVPQWGKLPWNVYRIWMCVRSGLGSTNLYS